MSLNRTLERFFDEVRREAKRNPAFADRLDAVLGAHTSRREVDEDVLNEVLADEEKPAQAAVVRALDINPVGLMQREGEDALRAALDHPGVGEGELRALIEEHNLDPGAETDGFDRAALVAHILVQAQRRIARDKALFDY